MRAGRWRSVPRRAGPPTRRTGCRTSPKPNAGRGAKPADRPRTHFKLGPVFDRSQVDPLPPPANPVALDPPIAPVDGEELAWAFPPLIALAGELGSSVDLVALPVGQGGYYEIQTR